MTITDTANAIRLAMDPEVLAELVRLEVGGNPRPGQPVSKIEPHDTSRAVDFDRIRFALDNPLLPVPETVQSAPVAAVEPQPEPSPAEDGLWRPVGAEAAE